MGSVKPIVEFSIILGSKMNIETFRPKIGMGAENYFKIIGKRSKKKISKYEAIYKKSVRF